MRIFSHNSTRLIDQCYRTRAQKSSTTRNKKNTNASTSIVETKRHPLNVTFSSVTPEKIPRRRDR